MDQSELDTIRNEADDQGWEHHELETGRWSMVSVPEDVVELLDECAR